MKNCVIKDTTDIIRVAEEIINFQANIQGVEPDHLWHPNACQLPWHPDMYDDEFVAETNSHRPLKCGVRITTPHSQIVVEDIFHYGVLGPLDGVETLRFYVARAISHMVTTPAIIEIGVDFDTVAGVNIGLLRTQSRRTRTASTTRKIRHEGGTISK